MKKIFCLLLAFLFVDVAFATIIVPTRIGNTTGFTIIPTSSGHTHSGDIQELSSETSVKFTKGKHLSKDIRENFDRDTVYKYTELDTTYEYSECKCTFSETKMLTDSIEPATDTEATLYIRLTRARTVAIVFVILFVIAIFAFSLYACCNY